MEVQRIKQSQFQSLYSQEGAPKTYRKTVQIPQMLLVNAQDQQLLQANQ